MSRSEISGIPDGLKRLIAAESDPQTLMAVAKYLKATRNYVVLAWFSEQLLRRDRDNLRLWQFQAQALVELGFLSAADEVLDGIRGKIKSTNEDSMAVDLIALEGRIAKQRLIDAGPNDGKNRAHLATALKYYLAAYERAGDNRSLRYFPGINIVSLLSLAKRLNLSAPKGLSPNSWAQSVSDDLYAVQDRESHYHWWQATSAEIALSLGDYDRFAESVLALVGGRKTQQEIEIEEKALEKVRAGGYFQTLPAVDPNSADAFVLASFDRQLREIWAVDTQSSPRVLGVVMGLRQALLERSGGSLEFDADAFAAIYQKQAVFEDDGPLPFAWVLLGIQRAKSVAAIMIPDFVGSRRIGTGFLIAVEGGGGGHYLLTNQHVVSAEKPSAGKLNSVRVRFEAVDATILLQPTAIVWESELHDASLLRLTSVPEGAVALEPRAALPPLNNAARVYVIGHASGEQLQMSLQDNELLDEEVGRGDESPVRLHYRAPTREGSSGSPVFAKEEWALIALHRATLTRDGSTGMTLSGYRYYNRANEGVSIVSIDAALRHAVKGLGFRFIS